MANLADIRDGSLKDLMSRMTGDISTLFQKEIQLAKIEAKEDLTRAGKAGGMYGAAAFTGYLCLLFVSLAIALLLDEVMPAPLAFAIVAAVYGVAALVLMNKAKQNAKSLRGLPETKETIKEDVQWAKTRNS